MLRKLAARPGGHHARIPLHSSHRGKVARSVRERLDRYRGRNSRDGEQQTRIAPDAHVSAARPPRHVKRSPKTPARRAFGDDPSARAGSRGS